MNQIYFPSTSVTSSSGGVAFGSVLLYSNNLWLSNFLLQAASDATESVILPYSTYSDGYSVEVQFNFLVTASNIGEYNGFCLSSQLHGQSCFVVTPRSGTTQANAQFYIDDVISYWQPATKISTSATTRIEGMTKQAYPSSSTCVIRGFKNTWRCT